MDNDKIELIEDSGVDSLEESLDKPNDTSPSFSKEILEYLEDTFDIRKMIHYNMTVDYYKGVQSVLDHLRYLYDHNFQKI